MPFTKTPISHYLPNRYLQLHLINLSFSKTPSLNFVICNNTHYLFWWAINHHWQIRLTDSYRHCFTPYRRIERIAQWTHVLLLRILPSMIHQFSSCSLKVVVLTTIEICWLSKKTEFCDQWLNNSSNSHVVMVDRCIFNDKIQNSMCTVPYNSNVCWTTDLLSIKKIQIRTWSWVYSVAQKIVVRVHISYSCMISKHNGIMTTRSKAVITPSSIPLLPPSVRTQNRKKREHFPGHPCVEIALPATDEDVRNLRKSRMLRTHLLNFYISQAAPTATTEDKSDPNGCTTYLAGLGVQHYIQESKILLSDMTQHARKIQRIWGSVQTIATNKQSAIIFPVIESHHFYVLVVQIALFSRSLYKRVHCYDSLQHSERGWGQKGAGTSEQQQFLEQLNTYIMMFIFHENEDLHQP